jgi:hypothetical protein
MAYGTLKADVIQSDTAGTPPQFNDGNSTQIGTLCRAWVNFDGTGTVAIRASFNVSSITDNGTGDYTVNFSNAMPDANYTFLAFCKTSSGAQNRTAFANGDNGNTGQSASGYRFYTTTLAGTPRIEPSDRLENTGSRYRRPFRLATGIARSRQYTPRSRTDTQSRSSSFQKPFHA